MTAFGAKRTTTFTSVYPTQPLSIPLKACANSTRVDWVCPKLSFGDRIERRIRANEMIRCLTLKKI